MGDRDLSAVARPSDKTKLRPVERVPRDRHATARDLCVLLYPGVNAKERAAVEEGFAFCITPHTLEVGQGPVVVQHTRPSLPEYLPDRILPVELDPFLQGGRDPVTGLSALGFRPLGAFPLALAVPEVAPQGAWSGS
jgi:hypothetical protein